LLVLKIWDPIVTRRLRPSVVRHIVMMKGEPCDGP